MRRYLWAIVLTLGLLSGLLFAGTAMASGPWEVFPAPSHR